MAKVRVLIAISFVSGATLGALTFAAAGHHVRSLVAADDSGWWDAATAVEGRSTPSGELGPYESVAADEVTAADSNRDERWSEVDELLFALGQRVAALEEMVVELAAASQPEVSSGSTNSSAAGMNRENLIAAGVDERAAADLLRRQSQIEMQRLELRDRASREGWIDSERFLQELRQLEGDVGALREEIGDEAYDRFLYLTGQPNRVAIDSIIDQSPAQLAGLQAGDLVIDYADSRVFSYSDLRDATRAGERGESVLLRVERDGEILELTLPRGPLGIRLDSDQVDPDAAG